MTDTERAKRMHDLLYSCESREEMCERVVKLEELCADLYEFAVDTCLNAINGPEQMRRYFNEGLELSHRMCELGVPDA